MLIVDITVAESYYEGIHPITGKEVKVKWKDFSQEELWAILDTASMNIQNFDANSDFIRPEPAQTKQANNVTTTAPSTGTANNTVTTTAAKGKVSQGEGE